MYCSVLYCSVLPSDKVFNLYARCRTDVFFYVLYCVYAYTQQQVAAGTLYYYDMIYPAEMVVWYMKNASPLAPRSLSPPPVF